MCAAHCRRLFLLQFQKKQVTQYEKASKIER